MKRYFERCKIIDYHIRKRSTGTPARFAHKLDISRSNLYLYLDSMKKMGAPIVYSRMNTSFFYSEPFDLIDLFKIPISLPKKKYSLSNSFSVQL